MRTLHWLIPLGLLACLSLPGSAVPQETTPTPSPASSSAESDFKKGVELIEKHRYTEALPLFEKVMQAEPKEPSVLWNTGVTAQYCGNYPLALRAWKGMREVEPQNWKVRCKLIQVYQAMGSVAERDSERSLLLDLRKKSPTVVKDDAFCCDQFAFKDLYVLGYEAFDFTGDRAVKYTFYVTDLQREKNLYRLSWGSYEATTQIARQLGEIQSDQRIYHLDYYAPGEHRTYAFTEKEPDYEQAKTVILEILEGKRKALSGSSTNSAPPKNPGPGSKLNTKSNSKSGGQGSEKKP